MKATNEGEPCNQGEVNSTKLRLLKTQFFGKKEDHFPATKLFGKFFSRIIDYENLSEQFIRVCKVLWQLLCKL